MRTTRTLNISETARVYQFDCGKDVYEVEFLA
jgi:hypothetical protein